MNSKLKHLIAAPLTGYNPDGDTFKGAMCPAEKSEIDFSVKGRKRDGTP